MPHIQRPPEDPSLRAWRKGVLAAIEKRRNPRAAAIADFKKAVRAELARPRHTEQSVRTAFDEIATELAGRSFRIVAAGVSEAQLRSMHRSVGASDGAHMEQRSQLPNITFLD